MIDIPDAPWVRQAERDGMPPYDEEEEVNCPICGKECESIYLDKDNEPFGCDECVKKMDAYEWRRKEQND